MKNYMHLSYIWVLAFLISFSLVFFNNASAEKDKHAKDIVQGNIVCLLPDRDAGTVKPVIATEPCHGNEPHAHVIVGTTGEHKGFVYAVEGSPEAIKRLEQRKDRKDVKIEGNIRGTQRGWILSVE